MLYALVFLVVGLLAGALGVFGVAAIATQIDWNLFVIGVILIAAPGNAGVRLPRAHRILPV